MKRINSFKLIIMTGALALTATACGGANDTAGEAEPASEAVAEYPEQEAAPDAPVTDETASEGEKQDQTEATGQEPHDLSADELKAIEEDFNTPTYNGFLVTEFATPQDIWWTEVFYNGAGKESESPDGDTVMQAYFDQTGDDELFGDLTYISTDEIEKFVEETTGSSYTDMKHPLNWLYLEDLDVYTYQHGDTNFSPVKCMSGRVSGDRYSVIYGSEYAPSEDNVFEVIFEKKDGKYVFESNLWAPEGGREERIEAIFDSLIRKYAVAVAGKWDEERLDETNISEWCVREYNSGNPSDIIGYYKEDIDGDGVDELLFGVNRDDGPEAVFDAYTVKDGAWMRLFMSDDDNRYYMAEDGTFYNRTDFDGVCVSHQKMDGPYKFLVDIESVRDTDGVFEYSTDGFWKDIKEISEKEFNDFITLAEDSYYNIKYKPLSSVEIDIPANDTEEKSDTTAAGGSGYSDDELCTMALDHYEKEYDYRPGIAQIDSTDGDIVTIHLYDDMGDHTATSAWYEIDRTTGKGSDMIFGDPVNLVGE